jgi:BirA family biotin operon repressor/biotin-[acetyl-CoA-carboxylase] ligase
MRVNRNRFAAAIIGELYSLYEKSPQEFMDEYRQSSFLIGRNISFSDGHDEFSGKVVGIGDGCELMLETDGKTKAFTHGEITKF